MINFYDLTLQQLREEITGMGKERFRAQQLFKWVYERGVLDFKEMSNISKKSQEEFSKMFFFELPRVVETLRSRDGTIKLLIDVGSDQTVEAVLIPSGERLTLCVSSEVGCNMACRFCYTGKTKLKRRLSISQIVGQFLQAQKALSEGQRITNIVFMGMGEPLDNPEGVFGAIEILKNENGINFSRKKITVSTSGLVKLIPEVTRAGVRLAVSLNASNDEIRNHVMPINLRHPIKELMQACIDYYAESKDRITFEYVLLKGVTDQVEHARELVKLTRAVPCKINLIPFNEHPGSGFLRPDQETVARFKNELIRLGAHVLVRKTMGRDIYAACGQLTSKYAERPNSMRPEELAQADYSYV